MDIIIDVSKWNGEMNFETAANAGAKGAIIRAGSINYVSGVPYTDYRFEKNADDAPKHLDHVGFYWFWRANQDPRLQARYFSNLIEHKTWDIPPVADIEKSNGVGPLTLTNNFKIFLDEVESRTDTRPMIYTRASYWNIATTKPNWALNYKLWCARWVSVTPSLPPVMKTGPWVDGRFKPLPWANKGEDNWDYWQFWADRNRQAAKYGGGPAGDPDMDISYRRIPFDDVPPVVDTVEINREVALSMYEELKKSLS